ncbi:DUF692 family multinuclear iron-containing protein [Heyndrickxia oleronia]|uniref:DUF692 family protein n=1 Tax=Heyndrickxia oleronia TaxID=38875 RepID=A0AAW6SWM4_9BACI|nr:DUF692 family multinuclear iron-containing protein [Heyndrickxia oleronia]MDH5162605.1 DUF692 family protein [Heyndrickxia oleronia]
MKVAVNYSTEAEQLIKDSLIDVDVFKCPDFSKELIQRAERTKPCYVHFGLNAGSGQIENVDWALIKELKNWTQTPYVNVHAVAYSKHYPQFDVLTDESSHINLVVDAVIRDIEIVADKIGIENVIMENVICRGKGDNMMKSVIDPFVLSEIVNRTGCGFLLDTAHAQMTSICLGLNVKEYISQLPVSSLKELHITGIQKDANGRLRDSMPMTKDDWELASWVLRKIENAEFSKPWVVAMEYGGVGPAFEWRSEENVLAEQVPEFYKMVKLNQH